MPADTLFPLISTIGDELDRHGHLDAFRSVSNTFLIALDGTDFFSEKIACPFCSQFKLGNGKKQHRHIVVTPVLLAPGQNNVIALPPHFVTPQDGHAKQVSICIK